MQHEAHSISEHSESGAGARVVAILAIVAVLAGIGGYVVYGSGLWNPVPEHTEP